MEKIQDWAKRLHEKVYEKWQSIEDPEIQKNGFATFYSPVMAKPKLLILGLNPGGGEDAFEKDTANHLPERHDYLNKNYPMGIKMVEILGNDLIEESVKTNLVFFRSSNWKEWQKRPLSNELIQFCFQEVKSIIETLEPQNILCEGFSTIDWLFYLNGQKLKEQYTLELYTEKKTKSLLYGADFINNSHQTTPVYAIPHPTGARGYTSDQFNEISKWLLRFIE